MGQLPTELEPNKSYTLKGVLILQVQDEGMVGDLVSQMGLQVMLQTSELPHADFENSILQAESTGMYHENSQRLVLVPNDKEIYKGLNLPIRTLVTCEAKFQGYQSQTLVTGEQVRLPIFTIYKVLVYGNPRSIISFRSLDDQFKEVDSELASGDVVNAKADLARISAGHGDDNRLAAYQGKLAAAQSTSALASFQAALTAGDYQSADAAFVGLRSLSLDDVAMAPVVTKMVTFGNGLLDAIQAKVDSGDLRTADAALTGFTRFTPTEAAFSDLQKRAQVISDGIARKAKQPLLSASAPGKVYFGQNLNLDHFKLTFLDRAGDGSQTVKMEDINYPQFYKTYQASIIPKATVASNLGVAPASRVDWVLQLSALDTDGTLYDYGGPGRYTYKEYGSSADGVDVPHPLFWGLAYGKQSAKPSVLYFVPEQPGKLMGYSGINENSGGPGGKFVDPMELSDHPLTAHSLRFPALGVAMMPTFADMPKGYYILETNFDGAASAARLAKGDIITSFNGKDLGNVSIDQFQALVSSLPDRTQVTVGFLQQGFRQGNASVSLNKDPNQVSGDATVLYDSPAPGEVGNAQPFLGVAVSNSNGSGMPITTVGADSPAQKAGLRPGDVIEALDDLYIITSGVQDHWGFQNIVNQYRPGDSLVVVVRRGGTKIKFHVKLAAKTPGTRREGPLLTSIVPTGGEAESSVSSAPTTVQVISAPPEVRSSPGLIPADTVASTTSSSIASSAPPPVVTQPAILPQPIQPPPSIPQVTDAHIDQPPANPTASPPGIGVPLQGYLGAAISDKDGPGLRIHQVVVSSPAEQAGLKVGDVVVSMDGKPAPATPQAFVAMLRQHAPGDTVQLWVNRNGENQSFSVTLSARPLPASSSATVQSNTTQFVPTPSNLPSELEPGLIPVRTAVPPAPSGSLTKQQWRDRLAKANPLFGATGSIRVSKSNLLRLLGPPQKFQVIENQMLWYYQCTDGTMQVLLDNVKLSQGMALGSVNEL